MKEAVAALAVMVVLPIVALAQKPVTQTDSLEVTAEVVAIDQTNRLVTLKHKTGELQTTRAAPEVKRLNELRVGDSITFRYYQSVAYSIRKPSQPGSAPATGEPTITRGTGAKPSATIASRQTATVTIESIDTKALSLSVLTEDGQTLSFKVGDKRDLQGLKTGDKVEVVYTQAVMISVK